VRVALAAGADGLRPQNLAVFADEDRGAVADAGAVEPQAVGLGDFALGVEVGQEGIVDPAQALRPCLVTELGIDANAQDLDIDGFVVGRDCFEAGNLGASGGREVERVEDEQRVLGLEQVAQLDLAVKVAIELKVRSAGAGCDDGRHVLFQVSVEAEFRR